MSLYERVPPIDLSPAFNDPPYSPFAVRDYLRLLDDLLYFPQAVRDYARSFARRVRSESSPPPGRSADAWIAWLRDNPVQMHFLWMVCVLGMIVIFLFINGAGLLAALLAGAALPLGAMGGALVLAVVSLIVMVGIGAMGDEAGALAPFALPAALAIGLTWLACAAAPTMGLRDGFTGLGLLAFLAALAFGVAAAALFATTSLSINGLATQGIGAAVVSLLMVVSVAFFAWPGSRNASLAAPNLLDLLGLALLTAGGYLLGALRIDDYLLHSRFPGAAPTAEGWLSIARVTPLQLPHLHDHMTAWLDFDWQQGMDNCVSVWWYTGQQASVRGAMHEVLRDDNPTPLAPDPNVKLDAATPQPVPRTLAMIARVADDPQRYPWGMIAYERTSVRDLWSALTGRAPTPAEAVSPSTQRRLKRQRQRAGAVNSWAARPLPTDTPEEAVAAGYRYLDRGDPLAATSAFRKGPPGPQTAEITSLAEALQTVGSEENLLTNLKLKLPVRPLVPFRPAAWDALEKVQQVVLLANLARQAVAPERRFIAADKAGDLLEQLASPSSPTSVECRYLARLASHWETDLQEWVDGASVPQPSGPVPNPFIYAEPLRSGRMFVGRKSELAALAQAWQRDNLQPIQLCGLPLVGKTSLLYAAERATPSVELAWFHLGHTDRKRMALTQALAAVGQAVRQASVLDLATVPPARQSPSAETPAPAPTTDAFGETEQLIRRSCTLLQPRSLVLVLDDFDVAASVLDSEGSLGTFLDFSAHLCQSITNFTVVFVYQSVSSALLLPDALSRSVPVRVVELPLLGAADAARLLRPPGFQLYFDDDAVAHVVQATGGHPYLVQSIGHYAVGRFNRRAETRTGESLVLDDDVQGVLEDPDFLQRAAALFRRLDGIEQDKRGPKQAHATNPALTATLYNEWRQKQLTQAPHGLAAQPAEPT